MTDEVVVRLYRALMEELRRRGHPPDRPVKVGQLYEDLVPYRAVRGRLGVELNADYEHAMLRLLAGERGLLRLEPEHARAELREEVDAPFPQVGLFRKFSAYNVRLERPEELTRPDAEDDGGGTAEVGPALSGAPGAARSGDRDLRIAAEADGPVTHGGAAAERAPVRLHRSIDTDPADSPDVGERVCAFCEGALPAGRRIRFCPRCGGDQRLRPCPRCDAVLERDWQYCISCGHELAG
ncbi:MAG: zinc ribbon domain-containing protein [Longimicrobiales bacterium]|nr:zinc ribbon domain-containing protein [Longimicrobiales bacterium]